MPALLGTALTTFWRTAVNAQRRFEILHASTMSLDNGFEGNTMTDEDVAAVSAKGPPPAPEYTNLA